jgi:hypothetical protein
MGTRRRTVKKEGAASQRATVPVIDKEKLRDRLRIIGESTCSSCSTTSSRSCHGLALRRRRAKASVDGGLTVGRDSRSSSARRREI